jgi:hypothetical protein
MGEIARHEERRDERKRRYAGCREREKRCIIGHDATFYATYEIGSPYKPSDESEAVWLKWIEDERARVFRSEAGGAVKIKH